MNLIKRYDFLNFVTVWYHHKFVNNKRSRKKIASKYHNFMFWCDQTNQRLDQLSLINPMNKGNRHCIYQYIFDLYKQYKVFMALENLRKDKSNIKQKMLNKIRQ